MVIAEYELVDKLVVKANSEKTINKLILRARPGEKGVDNPPCSIIWWDGTIGSGDELRGATSYVNQILHVESIPRIGFASYALTEEECVEAFNEMRNIIIGAFPGNITGRQAQGPLEPALGDVPLKEGKLFFIGGYAQLTWKYKKEFMIF